MLGIVDTSLAQAVAGVIASERIQSLDAIYYESHRTYQAQYINPDMPVAVAEAQSYLLGTTESFASAQVIGALPPHAGLQGGRLAGLPRTAAGAGMQWSNQRGFLVISGHGTFRNERSDFPARLVDIAPTLESLLGLPVVQGDGDVLADATFRPPSGAARIQQRVKARWSSYLNALQSWENRAR
jgi:hypothetical protein